MEFSESRKWKELTDQYNRYHSYKKYQPFWVHYTDNIMFFSSTNFLKLISA